MFTLGEIIDIAIQIEENGESFYRRALEIIRDPALENLLQWLAEEELRHRECFLNMKASMSTGSNDRLAEQVSGAILQSAVGDHAFSLEEVDFNSIEDEAMLIETAMGFEQDSIMFYEMIQSFVSDPMILAHANRIIEEERKHTELLQERQRTRQEPASGR